MRVKVVAVMKLHTVIPAALMLSACLSHPPPSPAPYRAIGQEPGWTLIIDERDLTFIPAGGQLVRQPKPQAIIGVAGEIYQTPRIGVNIVHAQCSDVMSGQGYADRVQVDVDGKRYEGCGGDLTSPAP
jgi:heat shock protein HslJ